MPFVPKKNIDPRIGDIKPPKPKESLQPTVAESVPPPPIPRDVPGVPPSSSHSHFVLIFFALLVMGGVVVFGVKSGLNKDASPNPQDSENIGNFNDLKDKALPFLKNAGDAYGIFKDASQETLALLDEVSNLENNWPAIIKGSGGETMIQSLERAQGHLGELQDAIKRLSGGNSELKALAPFSDSDYQAAEAHVERVHRFFSAFIPWLKEEKEHHILLLLQNPSELRPGGGFVGSYVDLTLQKGNIKGYEVHDINDSDRELAKNIIPPKPLQALVGRWRAADANWFFDWRTSARKVSELIEASKKYSGVQFDGVIGVSANMMSDVLSLTGPVELGDGLPPVSAGGAQAGKTITKDNFLIEIQKEVQEGQANKTENPKAILGTLAPLLLDRMAQLPSGDREKLFGLIKERIEEKDLLFYFKDLAFQNFLDSYAVSGRLFDINEDFYGDYLAVASANIGGGKSDLYMKQKVVLTSRIQNDGKVFNHLTVTRTHEGKDSEYSWYRVPNHSYLQIFTPAKAELTASSGGLLRTITPRSDYRGFVTDSDLRAIESTEGKTISKQVASFFEFGRKVFATWTKTNPGEATETSFDYTHTLPARPLAGMTYQFVFEKQSGMQGEYVFKIAAPEGFRFRENQSRVFEYASSDPKGRVDLQLTLEIL